MTRSAPPGGLPPEAEYLAAVEEKLAELSGAPLILSTRDWETVRHWHRRGIPLSVVLRSLTDVLGAPRAAGEGEPRPRLRPLAYCARAVEQRWKARREAAVGSSAPASPPPARLRTVLRALAREVRCAARRASGARRNVANPLRALARSIEAMPPRLVPGANSLEQITPSLLAAEAAWRAGVREALGEAWEELCRDERQRLGARLRGMSEEAARATAEAAALRRLREELGIPALDSGALHARLLRAPARRRLTPRSDPL